jgi:hypothetical protein
MRAHFNGFKALLTAVPQLTDRTYSNIRITGGSAVRDNYIVLFPDAPADLGDNRYTSRQARDSKSRWRYDVRVVAVNADGMLLFADWVMSVIGKTPIVAARKCDPVSLVPGVEEGKGRYDSATDLHYLDLSFEFVSRRA